MLTNWNFIRACKKEKSIPSSPQTTSPDATTTVMSGWMPWLRVRLTGAGPGFAALEIYTLLGTHLKENKIQNQEQKGIHI